MKKLLLSLGALTAVVAPVAAVIACDSKTKESKAPAVTHKSSTTGTQGVSHKNSGDAEQGDSHNKMSPEEARVSISKATPEDIAKHLTYQGRQMKYFYVVTKVNADGTFDILETHNYNGQNIQYTNHLVKSQENAGSHDLILNPHFDTSTIKIGMVIGQEDIKGSDYVTKKTTQDGKYKYFIINDLQLDENFVATDEPISTGILEPSENLDTSSLPDNTPVDLNRIDLSKAVSPELTTTLISNSKIPVIKANWKLFIQNVHTVDEFVNMTCSMAYPGNPSASIKASVKKWVENVLANAKKPTDSDGNIIDTTPTIGVLDGEDFDTDTAKDILGTLISHKRLDGIKQHWDEITKITDKDKLISKIGELSYGDDLNSGELKNITKWVEKIISLKGSGNGQDIKVVPKAPTPTVPTSTPIAPAVAATTNEGATTVQAPVSTQPIDQTDIDLSTLDIDTIMGHDYTSGLISSKHQQGVRDGWSDVIKNAHTMTELVDQVFALAYPGSTDKGVEGNILKWAKRVFGQEPLAASNPYYTPYKGS